MLNHELNTLTPQRITAYSPETLHLGAPTECWELAEIHQIQALVTLCCRWLHGTNSWRHRIVNEFNRSYYEIYCKVFFNLHTNNIVLLKVMTHSKSVFTSHFLFFPALYPSLLSSTYSHSTLLFIKKCS